MKTLRKVGLHLEESEELGVERWNYISKYEIQVCLQLEDEECECRVSEDDLVFHMTQLCYGLRDGAGRAFDVYANADEDKIDIDWGSEVEEVAIKTFISDRLTPEGMSILMIEMAAYEKYRWANQELHAHLDRISDGVDVTASTLLVPPVLRPAV